MTIPHQVTFHVAAHQRVAIEPLIAERVEKLLHFNDRILNCRVVVTVPNHSHQSGNTVEVTIDVSVPGHEPIIVNHHGDAGDDAEGLQRSVRDSFSAMERQLRDLHDKRAQH